MPERVPYFSKRLRDTRVGPPVRDSLILWAWAGYTSASDVKARYLRPMVLKLNVIVCSASGIPRKEGRKQGWREGSVTLFTLKMNFTASHISCPTNSLDGTRQVGPELAWPRSRGARPHCEKIQSAGACLMPSLLRRILCKCALLSTGRRHDGDL